MSRQVPRLRLFGGDHRSTVWFGLARLLMPDEYKRVETIRRSRRERAKREKEKAVAEEASAGEDAGGVTATDANAATGGESTNGADNAAVRSDAGGGAEGNDGGGKADEPSADGTPEGAEEPDNHQDHNSDGEPVEHGAAPSDTGDLPQAEPSDDQGTSRNGNDTEPDGTVEQPPSQHGSGSALGGNRDKTNGEVERGVVKKQGSSRASTPLGAPSSRRSSRASSMLRAQSVSSSTTLAPDLSTAPGSQVRAPTAGRSGHSSSPADQQSSASRHRTRATASTGSSRRTSATGGTISHTRARKSRPSSSNSRILTSQQGSSPPSPQAVQIPPGTSWEWPPHTHFQNRARAHGSPDRVSGTAVPSHPLMAYQYHSVLVGQDQHHGYTYHRQMMQYQQGHGHSLYMAAETMQFGPSSVPAYAAVPALHHPEQFYHS
ncbi:hypothetical protein ABEF93_006503 [Exophiala dermatitidis]